MSAIFNIQFLADVNGQASAQYFAKMIANEKLLEHTSITMTRTAHEGTAELVRLSSPKNQELFSILLDAMNESKEVTFRVRQLYKINPVLVDLSENQVNKYSEVSSDSDEQDIKDALAQVRRFTNIILPYEEVVEFVNNLGNDYLVQLADAPIRTAIADKITDDGKGRLMLNSDTKAFLNDHRKDDVASNRWSYRVIQEIRSYGSNSLASVFRRGDGVSYLEVLQDVAKHMRVSGKPKKMDTNEAENALIDSIIENVLRKLGNKELFEIAQEAGLEEFKSPADVDLNAVMEWAHRNPRAYYKLAAIITYNSIRVFTVENAIYLGANLIGRKVITGPMLVLSAATLVVDLASPATRVTVPTVIMVAMSRMNLRNLAAEAYEF